VVRFEFCDVITIAAELWEGSYEDHIFVSGRATELLLLFVLQWARKGKTG